MGVLMFWRVGIPTMLLAWLLLAAPGAADIQRHTDSQGIIHISNKGPAASAQKSPENPGSTTGGLDPVKQPDFSAPPVTAGENHSPQIPTPVAARPQNTAQVPGGPNQQHGLARPGITVVPEMGGDAGALPVQKAAFRGEESGAAAIAQQMAVPRQPEAIQGGGIRRFRDRHGTLHITNVAPGPEDAGPGVLQAENNPDFKKEFLEELANRSAARPGAWPLQTVSWNGDDPDSIVPPALTAAAGIKEFTAVPGIRCYRDGRGVIHISNLGNDAGSKALAGKQPSSVQARAGPEEGRAPPPEGRPPPVAGTAAPAVRQAGTHKGEAAPMPPTALISAPFCGPQAALLGGIRRYRDRQGVWHVETAPAPGLPGPPLLPSLSELGRKLRMVSINPEAAYAAAFRSPGTLPRSVPSPGRNYGGISVSRDSRGRLTITNAPPALNLEKGAPVMEARAQLEPIIQEAGRTYALPPSLIRAVIKAESNFASWAVSPKGAMGLMQLMPGTATFLGVQEPFNPRENIFGGCRYLRLLIDAFGGSLPLALAGYNAGFQRVVDCGYRVPDIKETRDFLTQVMGYYLAEEKKGLLPRI